MDVKRSGEGPRVPFTTQNAVHLGKIAGGAGSAALQVIGLTAPKFKPKADKPTTREKVAAIGLKPVQAFAHAAKGLHCPGIVPKSHLNMHTAIVHSRSKK